MTKGGMNRAGENKIPQPHLLDMPQALKIRVINKGLYPRVFRRGKLHRAVDWIFNDMKMRSIHEEVSLMPVDMLQGLYHQYRQK